MDTEGQQPDAIPEDVLLYAALCEALLDYTISLILGGDDDTRHFIEQHLVSGTPLDRKRKMLRLLFEERKPDVAQTAPYTHLWSDLGRLFDYRNSIAHSQPDHGDRFNRLRRYKGENQPVVVIPRPDRGAGATREAVPLRARLHPDPPLRLRPPTARVLSLHAGRSLEVQHVLVARALHPDARRVPRAA